VYRHQLEHVPGELFPDTLAKDNLVLGAAQALWRNIRDAGPAAAAVSTAARPLLQAVGAKFGVALGPRPHERDSDNDEEGEEDRPLVVELAPV
jgi:hypothetical protein